MLSEKKNFQKILSIYDIENNCEKLVNKINSSLDI